jgi:hypothetical protein
VEQVVGRDISSMLNSFFGGKKDRSKKKKKAVEDATTAVSSPSLPPDAAVPEATATPSPVASP